jgi:Bacterial RNA polymerase, alpha chain C terminal domain
MQYPHWLIVAGAVLVVVGFIGFALHKNNAEPVENNLKQEAAPPEEPAECRDLLTKGLTEFREERVDLPKAREMTRIKKSTDAGLSNAERKDLRNREAKEAIADHEEAQRALHGNLERLREERLAREAAARPMLYPAPELPDDTPIENVRFSTRIRNALNAAGMKTIGEVRETSDENLLSLQDLGSSSISYLRKTLGAPSTDGVRPLGEKPD